MFCIVVWGGSSLALMWAYKVIISGQRSIQVNRVV